jgi:hypothetical protein
MQTSKNYIDRIKRHNMSKTLIDDLNDTRELNQAARRAVLGGYYLANHARLPPPGGPVPLPYPNTDLVNNTFQLAPAEEILLQK